MSGSCVERKVKQLVTHPSANHIYTYGYRKPSVASEVRRDARPQNYVVSNINS